MSQLVLYRKYRPRDFAELVGQEHVVTTLTNALKTNRVAHAYLFSGPRGVGKTTTARLIAKALNCVNLSKISEGNFVDKLNIRRNPISNEVSIKANGEGKFSVPCNSCSFCEAFNQGRSLNLIEIDAASNRGIDEIRELRDGVRFAPAEGKFKVYIIDETHQLTKEAFNALLKTLEEPPSHAVFILATTEFDKIPATIVSRTQHYDFRRPNIGQIADRLSLIAKKEGVKLHGDAARLIALAAEGSMRDAESIFGQIMAAEDKEISRASVENILGLPRREAAQKMFALVAKKNVASALALIQELADAGYDLSYFSKLLLSYFRNALFLQTDSNLKKFVEEEMLPDEYECLATHLAAFGPGDFARGLNIIFQNMQQFRKSPIPQLPLELTVIELIGNLNERNIHP